MHEYLPNTWRWKQQEWKQIRAEEGLNYKKNGDEKSGQEINKS